MLELTIFFILDDLCIPLYPLCNFRIKSLCLDKSTFCPCPKTSIKENKTNNVSLINMM